MTFNIEWGGEHVSFDNVVETIRRADVDVAGIQEAEGNLQQLADRLGWHHDARTYVVSSFPLLDPPGANGRFVYVEVSPGRVLAIANLHLPSDPYGPDLVRDGASLEEVLANEATAQLPMLDAYLPELASLSQTGMPVLVAGDFNSPAHTDWTAAMVGARPFLRFAVDWPVSIAMTEAGFRDSWREIFPDPARNPGLTWWAGRPPLETYAPGQNDAQDRIDYLWYDGLVEPVGVWLAGEAGGPEVSLALMPWPSDHRAVFAEFEVDLVAVPDLITTDRRVYAFDNEILVRGRFHASAGVSISVTNTLNGREIFRRRTTDPIFDWSLPAPGTGEYRVTASTGDKNMERFFWVLPENPIPEIGLHLTDDSLRLTWRNAPGNRNDYIAIYDANESDLVNGMLNYFYIDAMPHGELRLRNSPGVTAIPSRTIIARLMQDDGYEVLAESHAIRVPAAIAE